MAHTFFRNLQGGIRNPQSAIHNPFVPSRLRAFAFVGLVAFPAFSFAQRAESPPRSTTTLAKQQQVVFQHAVRAIAPSIVRIDTIGGAQPVRRETSVQQQRIAPGFRQADGPTTGLIWSPDGYILTSSFNFARDPVIITVMLSDGRRYVARLIARDLPARLALLKIDAADLPAPQWVDSDHLCAGQWVLAAGLGHGTDEPAVSVGILSALRRMSGQAVQTDAKISPANYGGPLFDVEGRVIGICVPMGPGEDELAGVEWYDSGIGFAIHHDHIRRRAPRLQQGQDLRRGLLGVFFDPHEPVVALGAGAGETGAPPTVEGLRIVGEARGPAAEVGLKAGDVVTHIDDEPTPRLVDFRRVVAHKAAGDTIKVSYRRGDRTAVITLQLAAAEDFRLSPALQPR
ncbi:MAG: S1C family serine protease [Phycisphaerae bacterium]